MKNILVAALLFALAAGGAFAHSKSKITIPAHEATVSSVAVIEMQFDDPMRVTAISLTGPQGNLEIIRETGMDAVTEFRAVPPVEMPAGAYVVTWRGLSADGHPMQGTFGFTIAD